MSANFGDNTLTHPFEIQEAREAQHKASGSQRNLSDALAKAHNALANAEYLYRCALSERMAELHAKGIPGAPSDGKGLAITTCEVVAKGEAPIALLRKTRDERRGDVAKIDQECFRAGADRRALDGLVRWSEHRDLRTDVPPPEWFDRQMGEVRS